MKYTIRFFKGFVILHLLISSIYSTAQNNRILYEPDTLTNFPNPERGFCPSIDPLFPAKVTWEFQSCDGYNYQDWTPSLQENKLNEWRKQGYTVVMIRYHIAEFRDKAISAEFLKRLNSDFSLARNAGFKLIPRFVYNWPMGGPDAPIEIILRHIAQLKEVFTKNVDVINFVELGFIGSWGEQHHSCNGLVDGMLTPNAKSWKIIDSLFSAVPPERMIAFRYPFWKFRFNGNISDTPSLPITESEAYTGTKNSRWAQHDDCLVCGEWNVGTWNTSRNNAKEIINFLSEDNHFVFQGGEPGDPRTSKVTTDEDGDGYILPNHTSCDRMRWILEKDHWSTMNVSYGENFNNKAYLAWKEGGCYDEIALHLGYRFRLVEANIPEESFLDKEFSMSFTIHNDGWASPHNPRGLEIILRNTTTQAITKLIVTDGSGIPENHDHDPRFWMGGKEITIKVLQKLPSTLAPGEYEILINMPDPLLYGRPEFSIRLANKNIWEAATGYNSLSRKIIIQ